MPMKGASLQLLLLRLADQAPIMAVSRSTASSRPGSSSACRQSSDFHTLAAERSARLRQAELDDAAADVGAADIDRDDAVVAREDPGSAQAARTPISPASSGWWRIGWRSMPICSSFRMTEVRPIDELAEPAVAKAAADHDALDAAPCLQPQKAADHAREPLRKLLGGALDDAGGFRLARRPAACRTASCRSPRSACRRADRRRARAAFARISSTSARKAPLLARSPIKPSSSLISTL